MESALKNKYKLTKLPITEEFLREKRLIQERGELVLITDGHIFKHITYFSLKPGSNYYRGGHYHKKKTENFYVITGKLRLVLKDVETGEKEEIILTAGDKLTIKPNCAHIFFAVEFSQVIEYYDSPYDPKDDFMYKDF